jgi:hypothetical protein
LGLQVASASVGWSPFRVLLGPLQGSSIDSRTQGCAVSHHQVATEPQSRLPGHARYRVQTSKETKNGFCDFATETVWRRAEASMAVLSSEVNKELRNWETTLAHEVHLLARGIGPDDRPHRRCGREHVA